jgi:2-keto-4-pentenoate hydratase
LSNPDKYCVGHYKKHRLVGNFGKVVGNSVTLVQDSLVVTVAATQIKAGYLSEKTVTNSDGTVSNQISSKIFNLVPNL